MMRETEIFAVQQRLMTAKDAGKKVTILMVTGSSTNSGKVVAVADEYVEIDEPHDRYASPSTRGLFMPYSSIVAVAVER